MTTVFCWGAGWADFVTDGCEWEGVERPEVFACAQETEHWQKMPSERRADKQVADFTAYASQENFETWGNHDFEQTILRNGPCERKNPEDLSQLSG
jgi:hypothetical protein